VGVLDFPRRTLQFVDAGHGYAMLADACGAWQQLGDGHVPIGVVDDYPYASVTVPLLPNGRLLLVSDGIIEQFDPPGDTPELKQFGIEGIEATTRAVPQVGDIVGALFNAVVKHAGRPSLTDDATAVVVKWGESEGNSKSETRNPKQT
jgi:sigma-B regulation protein RsbU (phosphoserine phosphatase)